MDGTKIYNQSWNNSASVANNATKRLIFKDASGNRTKAQITNIRCIPADFAWDGKVHMKAFNRGVDASYNVNKFVTSGGVYSIHLDEESSAKGGHFAAGDKLVVTGSTAGTNDGTFTISSVAVVSGLLVLYVKEAVTGQTASPAIVKNTVVVGHWPYVSGDTDRTVPMTCSEIHFLNVDAVGAVAMTVYIDAYSDEDISGTTFA